MAGKYNKRNFDWITIEKLTSEKDLETSRFNGEFKMKQTHSYGNGALCKICDSNMDDHKEFKKSLRCVSNKCNREELTCPYKNRIVKCILTDVMLVQELADTEHLNIDPTAVDVKSKIP